MVKTVCCWHKVKKKKRQNKQQKNDRIDWNRYAKVDKHILETMQLLQEESS